MIDRWKNDRDSVEKKREDLFIEIGCDFRTILEDFSPEYLQKFRLNSNLRYVGIDIDERSVQKSDKYFQENLAAKFGQEAAQRVSFVRASGDNLPFTDESTAEVVFTNLIGLSSVPIYTRKEMLKEAFRVLKPGGILKVVETISPAALRRDGLSTVIEDIFGAPMQLNRPRSIDAGLALSNEDETHDAQIFSDRRRWRGAFIARVVKPAARG